MPFYHITHHIPLTPNKRQSFATALTNLHSTTFNAPSLFVNIRFTALGLALGNEEAFSIVDKYYVGGKRKERGNVIFGFVRGGGSRSKESFDRLAADIEALWDETVGEKGTLQAVFIVPGIVARERSFAIPEAGSEKEWYEENWSEFERRAKAGDEDFKGLVDEATERPELRR